jgi:hypothetical protein
MPKPTYASVTEEPCICHYLEHAADDPRSPIVYDAQLNEYNFEFTDPCGVGTCDAGNASLRIYHCPFCGGAAPASKRELLFAIVTPDEESRLHDLFGSIKTLDEAIQAFGPPDRDDPHGLTNKQPEGEGTAPTVESFRTLTYSRLSDTADVHLTETRTGSARFWLQGKYVGRPVDANDENDRGGGR